MSHDVTLTLRAELAPDAAQALLAFCEDWALIRPLPARPPEGLLRDAYEQLKPALADVAHDPSLHAALRRHRLDVETVAHHGPDAFNFLLGEFLPATLVSFEDGSLQYEGALSRTALLFDPVSRRLLQREERSSAGGEDDRQQADAHWLAGIGKMPATRWRKALGWWLNFVADLDRQREAFGGAAPQEPVVRWEDLQDFYCTELGLADGLGPAKRHGYLTLFQASALEVLDGSFRAFHPWGDGTRLGVLGNAQWVAICRQAAALGPILFEDGK